jgi:hypothetical protein
MTASLVAAERAAVAQDRKARKLDLWLSWWVFPVFYALFGVIFVVLTRVMPPPRPGVSSEQINAFFHDHSTTIKLGFALLIAFMGLSTLTNALVAIQMKRMSVKPVFAYGYIATLAVGAVPGCLFAAFFFLAAVFRPDRDPQLIALLYDMALLTFVGSLGCFTTNYLVLALAIFFDKNEIFPKWMAYVAFWQIATEVLAGPVFVFQKGAFAWNGAISFYEGTLIFSVFLTCLIMLLRRAIRQQPADEIVPD